MDSMENINEMTIVFTFQCDYFANIQYCNWILVVCNSCYGHGWDPMLSNICQHLISYPQAELPQDASCAQQQHQKHKNIFVYAKNNLFCVSIGSSSLWKFPTFPRCMIFYLCIDKIQNHIPVMRIHSQGKDTDKYNDCYQN